MGGTDRNYIDMVHDEFLMTDEFVTKESLWSAFWDGTEDKHPYHGEGNKACDKAYKKGRRMMGAEMLGRAAKRERQTAEKRRYDSLYWQESIRDKNPRHDFDYDNMDD